MADDLIRYDVLVQDALRGVVRKVLREVADGGGLPGEHHFYIAFDTTAPGVRMSGRLRQQHPEEMTVVLQHQFWDLMVTDHVFEVGLSFSSVPERLLIPFSAIKGFFDPSVNFGLQFDPSGASTNQPESSAGETAAGTPAPASVPALAPREDSASINTQDGQNVGAESADADGAAAPSSEGAEVVQLDAFRKKT